MQRRRRLETSLTPSRFALSGEDDSVTGKREEGKSGPTAVGALALDPEVESAVLATSKLAVESAPVQVEVSRPVAESQSTPESPSVPKSESVAGALSVRMPLKNAGEVSPEPPLVTSVTRATRSSIPPRLSDQEFEELVEKALDRIPPELMEAVENCAFIVEAEPPPGRPRLLGLYHGHPLTSRSDYGGAMPDTITIYQGPLQRLYRDPERLEHEVYRTVVHEIGHYFGLEEHELHELGWG